MEREKVEEADTGGDCSAKEQSKVKLMFYGAP